MSSPRPPADKLRNRPTCNEALKRRDALTVTVTALFAAALRQVEARECH